MHTSSGIHLYIELRNYTRAKFWAYLQHRFPSLRKKEKLEPPHGLKIKKTGENRVVIFKLEEEVKKASMSFQSNQ